MKDWSGNGMSLFVTNGDGSHSVQARDEWDYYATDPSAVEELLKVESFGKNVLEPACGGGAHLQGSGNKRTQRNEQGHSAARLRRPILGPGFFRLA